MSDPAPPHALLRPRVALPFLTISLIWGSTWFVITGQIDGVPPGWSVAWRFVLATLGMFALAMAAGNALAMPKRAHLLAAAIGLCQFCGNYNLVYQSELHLTSGIVAVMVGLMIVPNAVIGSTIAIGGIGLLLVNEARETRLGGDVGLGIWLALGAMLAASVSNVIQAGKTGRQVPLMPLIAWSMLYGTAIDIAMAAALEGPPVLPADGQYWLGTAYLAFAGSVITFPLYYRLIREIGAGRAAYHNVLVVIVAMGLSTLLEGYRWSTLAAAGAVLAMVGLIIALRAKSV